MMPFQFVSASSFEAATLFLADKKPGEVLVKSGGVDVIDRLKEGIDQPATILNLRPVRDGLKEPIRETPDGLVIHALTTLTEINSSELVREKYPALAAGTKKPATPQVRNQASIAGCLCQKPRCWYYRSLDFKCLKKGGDTCYAVGGDNRYHAILGAGACHIVAPSSAAPALLAYGAKLRIGRSNGGKFVERIIGLDEFYRVPANPQDDEWLLEFGELVLDITVPRAAAGPRAAYIELKEKQSFDWAMASCAVNLNDPANPRIVMGAVAPIPWRLPKIERLVAEALGGKAGKLNDETLAQLRQTALADAKPMTRNGYKVTLAAAVLEHALRQAGEGAA